MSTKVSIRVLATALLLSGLFAGVAHGGSRTIAEPQVVSVILGGVRADLAYSLRDQDGHRSAKLIVLKERALDENGDLVGIHRWECIVADGFGWTCDHLITLNAGPFTEAGTVALSGLFQGFNGEQQAITGGTGAYANARGYATLTADGRGLVTTLYLTP